MIHKSAESQGDVICIDMEDSVAHDQKAEARSNVIQSLAQLDFGHRIRMVDIDARFPGRGNTRDPG